MTYRLPAPLSERLGFSERSVSTPAGREIDYAIGGVEFRSAISADSPLTIETVAVRKEQLDVEAEPGEQSLSAWWRRSQESWHEGAGNLYQESRTDVVASAGFFDSEGVDVWTPGKMKLLPKMELWLSHAGGAAYKPMSIGADSNGADYLPLPTWSDGLWLHRATSVGGTITQFGVASIFGRFVQWVSNGAYFYAASLWGQLRKFNSTGSTDIRWYVDGVSWEEYQWGDMLYAKYRLWFCAMNSIYSIDETVVNNGTQAAIFDHPDTNWQYYSIAEGPSAVYFAGHNGTRSEIQAITLNTDGSLPSLSGATVVATMPEGELINKLAVVAGTYIAIGTNKGLRIGMIQPDGGIIYGPLMLSPEGLGQVPSMFEYGSATNIGVTTMVSRGSFLYVAFNVGGRPPEFYRVDLNRELSDGVFAYARDVQCGTVEGYIQSAAFIGDRLVVTDSNGNLWKQSATDLVESGWLETGRIRFRTLERKLFKHFDIETEPLAGTVVVSGHEETGTEFSVCSLTEQNSGGTKGAIIPSALGPQRHISLKFILQRSATDASKGPEITSYLVRAMPSVQPQRLANLPLLCYDKEVGRNGQVIGHDGYGAERYEALKALEDTGDSVVFQDFTKESPTSELVVIDSMRYLQLAPTHRVTGASGPGGVLLVQLRTVGA